MQLLCTHAAYSIKLGAMQHMLLIHSSSLLQQLSLSTGKGMSLRQSVLCSSRQAASC
jgi:hypothetical protein